MPAVLPGNNVYYWWKASEPGGLWVNYNIILRLTDFSFPCAEDIPWGDLGCYQVSASCGTRASPKARRSMPTIQFPHFKTELLEGREGRGDGNGSWTTRGTHSDKAPDIILLTFYVPCPALFCWILMPDNGLLYHLSVSVKTKLSVHSSDYANVCICKNILFPSSNLVDYFSHHTFEYTAWAYILPEYFGYILCNTLGCFLFSSCDFLMFLTDPYLWSL